MNYYFIYSAGGGAGDWNGIKRVWKDSMPEVLKKRVLLKFGDVFFNHASNKVPIRRTLWKKIVNVRQWLYENVNDSYVLNSTDILLDSGTSKLINYINTQNNDLTPEQIIYKFKGLLDTNNILEKYVEVITKSNINEAVTFDAPNPFKIRAKSENMSTNIFHETHDTMHVELNAEYCNKLYSLLGGQKNILTTINGLWDNTSIELFIKQLKYTPNKIAIGGITKSADAEMGRILNNISKVINLKELQRVHFLGCGGISKALSIKDAGFKDEQYSVDNSTPYNRAIDGNISGTKFSGYFDYTRKALIRITPETKDRILESHKNAKAKIFSDNEMKSIIDSIIRHQSGQSSKETYDSRAKLIIHNHDVFRQNAL